MGVDVVRPRLYSADVEPRIAPENILDVALVQARTQAALAKVLGLSQQAVSKRLKKVRKPVSAEEAVALERELGIPRHQSRPDLFMKDAPAPGERFHATATLETNR